MKQLAKYVVESNKQALFWCSLFAFVPLMGWLASALMALVTLRKGYKPGILLLISITLVDFLYSRFFLGEIDFRFILLDTVGNNLPTLLAALYLRRTHNWNRLIEYSTYIIMIFVLILHFAFPQITSWWIHQLSSLSERISDLTHGRMTAALIQQAAYYATGLQASLAFASFLFNLLIAYFLQNQLVNAAALKNELYFIRVPRHLVILGLLLASLSLANIHLAKDIVAISLVAPVCAGISLFYLFASKRRYGWAWLISFYALLLLAFPSVCLILVIVGLLDAFINLRPHLKSG